MKKIKGGKRVGAGRPKTGRNTEVVSFSIPKTHAKEIKELVKGRLNELAGLPKDFVDHGGKIAVINEKNEVVIHDLAEKIKTDAISKRISDIRNELKNPPKNPQIGLRTWIKLREKELKELETQTTNH